MRTDVILADRETHGLFTDKMRYIFLELPSLRREDRMKYDESIKAYRNRLAIMEFERQKGRAKDTWKGERAKQLEMACNLKQMGLSTGNIVQATGLAPDVIGGL